MQSEVDSEKECVVVTGFGLFGNFKINASWEAVRRLADTGIAEQLGIKLMLMEVPVEYDYVRQEIPRIWQQHRPKLMVHVGVSGAAQEINLEKQAFNNGYRCPDVIDCVPEDNCCIPGAEDFICSEIDMSLVCECVNNSCVGTFSCVSSDPGQYLCDFIYYTSLSINRNRAAFIHVPDLNKPYSAEQLSQGLKVAIAAMLEQVRAKDSVKPAV